MSKILGIDLGTTNSAMAVMEGGEPKVLENKEGNRTTPSMVAMSKNNERLVGQLAKRQAITNPKNTIFSVKRLIGRRFEDEEVQYAIKTLPFKIVKADAGVKVAMRDKEYTPQEISSFILQKMKMDAEERLGEKIEEVVITVPAYFNDSQRQATKEAGEIAGFKVRRIINEPTAAALAYGFEKKKGEQIAVYDLGGGTFDVSILDVSKDTVEVKSTAGNTYLGGDDFDRKIIDWILQEFRKDQGIDLSSDPLAMQRIKEAAEKAKVELSSAQETEINQPFITSDASGPKHMQIKLTRSKLEELVGDLVDRTFESVKQALQDAKLETQDIEEIIMVGGMTRMPQVQQKVEEFFGKKPHLGVNPDEVVAVGAAVQAGVLQGDVKDVLLLDVTPLTLGLETLGGVSTALIERNTTIPTSKSQIFSTAADNQTSVEIHVLQGERPMAQDNKSLGRFILDGIPPAPRGVPQIEVTFDIDANGILNVKAKDKATSKEQHITITGSTGLAKEDIEKMKRDAEAHMEEDKKKRDLIETRNLADSMIFQTEKALKEAGDKAPTDIKKEISEKVEALKKVLAKGEPASGEKDDYINEIKKATQDLTQTAQKLGQAMYGAQSAQQGQQETGNNPPAGEVWKQETKDEEKKEEKSDKAVEGEYEEVKEEKKN